MSEPKFTPGPWFVDHGVPGKPRIFSRADNLIKSMVCACEHGALSRQEHDAALIAAAPEMYESNALCLDETCVMQIAFTFACAKCEISKDTTKCKDCPIAAGMRAMFRQRDRISKLLEKASGEE